MVHIPWVMTKSSSTLLTAWVPKGPQKEPGSRVAQANGDVNRKHVQGACPVVPHICVRIYSYLSSNVSVRMLSSNGDVIPGHHGVSGMRPVQSLPPLNLDLIRERRQRFQAKGVHVKFSSTLIGDGVAEACLLEKFKKQMEQLQSIKLTWTGWGSWGSVSGRSPPEAPIRPLYVAG